VKLDCLMVTAVSAMQAAASPGWGGKKHFPVKSYLMCLSVYDVSHNEQLVNVVYLGNVNTSLSLHP
jgi:hypothetical protein